MVVRRAGGAVVRVRFTASRPGMENVIEISNPQKEEVASNGLTLKKAEDLIFWSFYFSQGDPELQRDLFRYIHFSQPKWDAQELNRVELTEKLNGRIERFFNLNQVDNPALHPVVKGDDVIKNNIESEVSDFYLFVRNIDSDALYSFTTKEKVIDMLSAKIAKRDERFKRKWIIQQKRKRTLPDDKSNPMRDRDLSQLCYYGLEGNTTRIGEFDQMFKDVSDHVRSFDPSEKPISSNDDVYKNFRQVYKNTKEVISTYNITHKKSIRIK